MGRRKGRPINYNEKLDPIYIDSVQASHVYISNIVEHEKPIQFKIGREWYDFKGVKTGQAVMTDSLLLRFINSSITRNSGDRCREFINVKFDYDAEYRFADEKTGEVIEESFDKDGLRDYFYNNGFDHTFITKYKNGDIKDEKRIHYKMLMRSTGKAKEGECIFVKEDLYEKAINFLTMDLYKIMERQSNDVPEKVFNIVAMSAYQTLSTATASDYIQIPLENILIVEDKDVYSEGMKAAIVRSEDIEHTVESDEYVIDFDDPWVEANINKKGFTFDREKADGDNLILIEKTKDAFKENGIRTNWRYPGEHVKQVEMYTRKKCTVTRVDDAEIKNVLWDGMGIIDESIFPKDREGFIYCRSHFFKSCLFRGNMQEFFKDYCEKNHAEYDKEYVKDGVDIFGRKMKLSDIKVIITDKSIKWLKFIDLMGGTYEEAFKYYHDYMEKHGNWFSIVKSAHKSRWRDWQKMAYQMCNSVPSTDMRILDSVVNTSSEYCNLLKDSDEEYLKYLEKEKNDFNINELLIELVKWNPKFLESELFREKKKRDISGLKSDFKAGNLFQTGDNLTIVDNPVALLMRAVGEDSLKEGCFKVLDDGVQCYTPRFKDGERIAAFRSPHNSPNNILHLYNVYPDKLLKYFPNIGNNVIVFNAIGTDTQCRLSGHDCDSDFVYVTNQKELVDLARMAYTDYPTIINKIKEIGESEYHFTLSDYAKMDNKIAIAQIAIGTSTDTAQLALSYYYNGNMESKELEDCFIILSVIGQVSIDSAKKEFDIDINKEIKRIQNLPCIKGKNIPLFFADVKEKRESKFDKEKVQFMFCPMDVMASLIDAKVKKYADRKVKKLLELDDFLNTEIVDKCDSEKIKKILDAAQGYYRSVRWLAKYKDTMDDDTFLKLKKHRLTRYMNIANKSLERGTIKTLIRYALKDENSDICTTILNFLFKNCKDEFMECFIKGDELNLKIEGKSA